MRTLASVLVACVLAGCAPSAPAECNAGPRFGCPCDGAPEPVCPGDLVCTPHGSGATWEIAVDICGELDAGLDGGHDANDLGEETGPSCTNEAQLTCAGGGGTVCCGGHVVSFNDGPCGLRPPDAGPIDAGADVDASVCGPNPLQFGCPCDADAGTPPCIWYGRASCTAGVWTSTDLACGICP